MEAKLVDVLNIEELSAYLRIPKSKPYKLVREAKIPSQEVGQHWRFRKKAIERWLEDWPANGLSHAVMTTEGLESGGNSQ